MPFSNLPRTLSVRDYARGRADGQSAGEGVLTPVAIAAEMVTRGKQAVEACQKARGLVEKNADEFARLCADFEATDLIARFYQLKIDAGMHFVAYQRKQQMAESREVLRLLRESVEIYRELANKTEHSYSVANDIRNDIPFPFHPPTGMAPMRPNSIPRRPHWKDFLPVFEAELEQYQKLLSGD
jgi:hypothetical protein